jgi:hypothetical protein
MKRLSQLLAIACAAATISVANALTYNPSDLLLVFHQTGQSNVVLNIGPVSNYIGRASGSVTTISYDKSTVTNNFGSLSNFSYAVVGANDAESHVWLSSTATNTTPADLTINTYSTLFGKIDSAGTSAKLNSGGGSGAFVVDSTADYSYSGIVSPSDPDNVGTMGGDAPVTVSRAAPGALALIQLVPTVTSPTPKAIKLGTFNLAGNGVLTYTAAAVTPVVVATAGASAVTTRGGSVTLSATAEGGTGGFQWYQNGVAIAH